MYLKSCSAVLRAFLVGSFLLSVLISCKREDSSPSLAGVYMVGYERVNGKSVAKYWKDGAEISLTDGSRHAFGKSAFVTDQDVYVCGEEFNSAGIRVAKYWKNGQPVDLGINCYAESIFVEGSDVYVAGAEFSGSSNIRAVYWKNGVINYLTTIATQAEAWSIAVSAGNVYVAGWEKVNIPFVPRYWKNGIGYTLGGGATSTGSLKSIAIAGADVYMAGGENTATVFSQAAYWKNDSKTALGPSNSESQINHMAISGTDVYAAGYEQTGGQNFAVYWKNGVMTRLTNGTDVGTAMAIGVKDGNIYVAGSNGGTTQNAVYWKNGTLVPLTNGANNSYCYGMFIK